MKDVEHLPLLKLSASPQLKTTHLCTFQINFSEPSFNYLTALAPFQPLMMKTVHCPIDTSVNFSQAKKLIREINPGCIAIPGRDIRHISDISLSVLGFRIAVRP